MTKKKDKSPTSFKETKFGILPRGDVIKLESQAVKKGMTLLLSSNKKSITSDFIKEVHKFCFSVILGKDGGKFRTVQVMYSGKEAPHFSKINELMINLCADTECAINNLPHKKDKDYLNRLIELLARFQHRFVYIHPFVDYNGRTARMFTSFILIKLNLPIIEIKVKSNKDRQKYIKALQKADEGYIEKLEKLVEESLTESLSILV